MKITSAWAGSVGGEDVGLVAVDADGELAVVRDGLQSADAGAAGDREDHVGALPELGESDFLALGGIDEGAGTALRIWMSGLAALAPWSKPILKSVTVGNSTPRMVPRMPVGELGGGVAGEIAGRRGLVLDAEHVVAVAGGVIGRSHRRSMNLTSGYCGASSAMKSIMSKVPAMTTS